MTANRPTNNLKRAAKKQWPSILATIVAAITGIAFGLLGLESDQRFTVVPMVVCLVIITAAVISVVFHVATIARALPIELPKDHTYNANIQKFMQDWLTGEGFSAIFSRDLSWADDAVMKAFLLARATDLLILVAHPTATARDLASAGAEVIEYHPLLSTPSSRFTIINYGNATSAQVAIGRSQTKVHQIERFSTGDHPAYHLAVDLVALARATGTRI